MERFIQGIAVMVLFFGLSACGKVHHQIATQPIDSYSVQQVAVTTVEVSSKEQNQDALSLNDQWKEVATEELQSMLDTKNIVTTDNSDTIVGCRIYVVYGNRALRYFVGFGAGAGHMDISIELKDRQGTILYATQSKADLAMGGFGGDMAQVARKTIIEAVKEFGARLQ